MTSIALCLALAGGNDLEDIARRHQFSWSCDAATGRHTVKWGFTTVVFAPGLDKALENNLPVALDEPVSVEGGRLRVPARLAEILRRAPMIDLAKKPITPPAPAPVPAQKPAEHDLRGATIAVDAGHGGLHTGGRGTFLMEKDINLGVSLELKRILESWGAKVLMTRESDRHFSSRVDDDLDVRVDKVNAWKPDLFLSIHTNWVDHAAPRGYEVWVPANARGARDRDSRDIAGLIRGELGGVWSSEDRGTKDDRNLRVLNGTRCPSSLVELEFVSNRAAERQLAQPETQKRLARAIADAVYRWVVKRK